MASDSPSLFPDPKSASFLTDIRASEPYHAYYHQLTAQIALLDSKVKTSLKGHEKDLLSAFRTHMHEVYQQVNDLKRKTDEQEWSRRRDEHVNKLESSLEWYKEEALHLAEACKAHKKECEKWKVKVDVLEEERKMLEIQLQAAKKQIKMYNEQWPNDPAQAEPLHFPAVHKSDPPLNSPFLSQLSAKANTSDPRFLQEVEKYVNTQEQKCQEAIKRLQSVVEGEKRKAKAVAAAQASAFLAKSDLESVFLECVEEVRREVQRRRTQAAMTAKYTTEATFTEPKSAFTPRDKRRILELLIGNEKVLVFLYEKLFPYRGSSITHARTNSEVTPLPPEDLPEAGFVHRGRTVRGTE